MSSYMLSLIVCLTILFAAIAAPVPKDRNGTRNDEIQGTWDLTERTIGKAKINSTIKMQWRFDAEGNMTMIRNVERNLSTAYLFKIDTTQKPKHITYQLSAESTPMQGIYEVNGDTLRICYSRVGKERPTSFTPGVGEYLYTFRRQAAK